MSPRPSASRRPRGSLAPDAIVVAARSFVEAHGLKGLTMAALARSMDVPVTSIHWHFRTRDDLVEALAAHTVADLYDAMPPLSPDGPWDQELLTHFGALRQHLRKSPAFLDLSVDRSRVLGRPAVKELIDRHFEEGAQLLVNAGLTREDACRVYHVCSVYVRGFTILELVAEHQYARPRAATPRTVLDPDQFPITSQVDLLAVTWEDPDHQFDLGLETLVAGLRATLVAEAPRSTTRRSPAGSRRPKRTS